MRRRRPAILVAALMATSMACWPSTAAAQSRKGVSLRTPGYLRGVGESARSNVFSIYSYGTGGLAAGGGGADSGVLRSSIGRAGTFSVSRGAAGGAEGLSGGLTGKAAFSSRVYTAMGVGPSPAYSRGPGTVDSLMSVESKAVGAASAYMVAINTSAQSELKTDSGPITSLVPSQPSPYKTYMESGEEALKAGDFDKAYDQFQLANHIGGKDPESLLNIAHAAFARSMFSYAEAAFYLRQALRYCPELPLFQLKPKAFYGQTLTGTGRYAECMTRLEDHLAQNRGDMNANFVLAYFRWFEGDVEEAGRILARAQGLARQIKDDEMVESISIFLDGMVASGLVPETPQPGGAPTPASRPADQQSAPQSDQTGTIPSSP